MNLKNPIFISLMVLISCAIIFYLILHTVKPTWIKQKDKIDYTKLISWSLLFGIFFGIISFLIFTKSLQTGPQQKQYISPSPKQTTMAFSDEGLI